MGNETNGVIGSTNSRNVLKAGNRWRR